MRQVQKTRLPEGASPKNMSTFQKISEASYLTAENAERYRCIIRVFYNAYEQMNFQLYKEDVLERLQRDFPALAGLSEDQIRLDLTQLVTWKNLVAIQDPKKVYTIAEYKNKQFRYSMSEASVEIERLTIRLENLFLEPASLSTNYFMRIEHALTVMQKLKPNDLNAVNEWWKDLQEDFRCLNQNYHDYLREFYTGRSEKLLKSVEFVVHKDRFITYLEDFIRKLQNYTDRIAGILRTIPEDRRTQILEAAVASELAVPRPQSEKREDLSEHLHSSIFGNWNSLEQWFIGADERPSESARILDITNEIIQKIIQNATLIVQLQNWGISRRSDYQRWIELFHQCETLEEAHRLSAFLFGAMEARHFQVNSCRSTDSISSPVSAEDPFTFTLSSHNRQYRPRAERSGYQLNELEKNERREAYLKQLEENRRQAVRYISGRRMILSEIQDEIPESLRISILSWITSANLNSSGQSRTEYGWKYQLIRNEGTCVLHCQDGDLTMPAYQFEFEEDIRE